MKFKIINKIIIGIMLLSINAFPQTTDSIIINHEEVVISASRFEEQLFESPVTINVISSIAIQGAASGDFFESLGNLPQIDIINNSINFKVFNTRGFNTTVGYRVVQMVDGADNLSSGINFSPGNFLSIPDIDMARTEVISGPASALYGPNALQGVVSILSKNPFDYEGLDIKIAGGNRAYFSGQFRYAQTVGNKKRFAFKIAGEYNRANDWVAKDENTNVYIPRPSSPQNLNLQIQQLSTDTNINFPVRQKFADFLAYANSNTNVLPGTKSFALKGYEEAELFDSLSENLKLFASLHYKVKDKTEIIASYRIVRASGTFQGNQRVYFNNQLYHQPKIEIRNKNLLIRTYATFENLGDSYSFNILGANLALAGLNDVKTNYLSEYINYIQQQSNNYNNNVDSVVITNANSYALEIAQNAWLQPGTEKFNEAFDRIIAEPAKPQGARFVNESKMFHTDAQYNFSIKNRIDFNVGASYRYNIPRTLGSVLSDTLLPNGKYSDISYYETGGFVQINKSILRDMIKFSGSVRIDKSNNFDVQVSPRGSVSFTLKKHNIRLLAQSAFRNPTQNEQFFLLNTGSIVVLGNVTGYTNLYTLNSVGDFATTGNVGLLQTITIPKIKPENVKSFEMGYRTALFNKLYFDLNCYYNMFSSFIGRINTAQPKTGNVEDSTGVGDILNGNFSRYSIIANSTATVNSYGASVSINYYVVKKLNVYSNYTFATIDSSKITDDLIPGFNTPKHKINIGIEGRNVWKGLGFSSNFRWIDNYFWQSPFATGSVPSYHTLDLQVNYAINKAHSIIRIGASNIYDNKHIEAFGASQIGAFYYASWTVSLGRDDLKKK